MPRVETRSSTGAVRARHFRFASEANSTPTNFRPKRPRNRTTLEQLAQLDALFDSDPSPTVPVKAELAKKLGMELKVVNIWFQNKRQTTKRRLLETMASHETIHPPSFPKHGSKQIPKFTRRDSTSSNSATATSSRCSSNVLHVDADERIEEGILEKSISKKQNILARMAASSPASSTLGRKRAALLVKFGHNITRLEWACANAYKRSAPKAAVSACRNSPVRISPSDGSPCSCSSSCCSTDDEEEAITPMSETVPLPPVTGFADKLKPVMFDTVSSIYGSADHTDEEVSAARILMTMAGYF